MTNAYHFTAGDRLDRDEANLLAEVNRKQLVAGENIDASAGPVLVYLKASDEKVWKADTDADESAYKIIGFIGGAQNVLADANVIVTTGGIMGGFSGLTAGDRLYSSATAGSYANSPVTTRPQEVGLVISTTEVFVYPHDMRVVEGSDSTGVGSSLVTSTVTIGFRPRFIIGTTYGADADNKVAGLDSFFIVNETLQTCTVIRVDGLNHSYVGGYTGKVGLMAISAGASGDIDINNITATSFDIVYNRFNPGTGVGGSVNYIAIG